MTVQTETSRSGPYAGAGTTGPFTVGFRFIANAHLRVIRTTAAGIDSTLLLNTDYSVSGAGGSTGTVTLTSALAPGEKLTIVRDVPFTQNADYVPGDAFPAESHEDALDLLTMQTQQLAEAQGRALTLPVTVSGASAELPSPSGLKVFGWNAAGTAIENLDANTLASIIAYGTAASDLFDGDGVTTAFSLSGNPASINNLDVSIGGVAQRPGLDYLWTNGTILTFTTAPAVGTDNILVRYMQALALGASVASDVSYQPAGTGAVTSTVQTKLREFVSRAEYSSDANYNTARNALTGRADHRVRAEGGTADRLLSAKLGDVVSVKDFGAVGDGLVDDAAAIRAAIAYCQSVLWGIRLVFPTGTYALGSRVDFVKTADRTIFIEADRARITRFGSYAGPLFYLGEETNSTAVTPFNLSGFIFSGPDLSPTVSALVLLKNANGMVIRDCVFSAGTSGVLLDNSYAVRLHNCTFIYQLSYGLVSTSACMNLLIDACQFIDIAAGQGFGSDIYFAALTHNINIVNSDFEGGRAAIGTDDAVNSFNFCGNYVEGKSALPIFLGAQSRGVKIENNWIGYNSGAQIWYNINGGSLKFNIFWDQVQSVDAGPSATQCVALDVGANAFAGTSSVFSTAWTPMTLINGYSNVGAPYPDAAYTKSSDGRITLRGMVSGAVDNSCFLLPVGLRPTSLQTYASIGSTRAAGSVFVYPDGSVTCFRSSNGTIDLSCASFFAA